MSEKKQYIATISFKTTIYAEDKKSAEKVAEQCVPNHIHMQANNYSARFLEGKVTKVGEVTHVRKPEGSDEEDSDKEE